MSNIREKKKVTVVIGLLTLVPSLVALCVYLIYVAQGASLNATLVLLPLIVMISTRVASFMIDSDLLILIGDAAGCVALFAFLRDSVEILIGYFTKVAIFGDATMFGIVITISALLLISTLISFIYSFIR